MNNTICSFDGLDSSAVYIATAWARLQSGGSSCFMASINNQSSTLSWEFTENTRGDYYPVLSISAVTTGSTKLDLIANQVTGGNGKIDAYFAILKIKTV